jgi:hypothetical protein
MTSTITISPINSNYEPSGQLKYANLYIRYKIVSATIFPDPHSGYARITLGDRMKQVPRDFKVFYYTDHDLGAKPRRVHILKIRECPSRSYASVFKHDGLYEQLGLMSIDGVTDSKRFKWEELKVSSTVITLI